MKTLSTVVYAIAVSVVIVVAIIFAVKVSAYNASFTQGCHVVGTQGYELCHNGEEAALTYMDGETRQLSTVPTTSLADVRAEVDIEVARVMDAIQNAPDYQSNNCITAVHVEGNMVYVSFAPCHSEGGVGTIYNIDAKFWSTDVAKHFQ